MHREDRTEQLAEPRNLRLPLVVASSRCPAGTATASSWSLNYASVMS
jgi:hypothetical protein